jgi:flagellar assembly factor FliW
MSKTIEFSTATAMEISDGTQSSAVPLEKEVIFKFKSGLPAFEDCKDFIFILDQNVEPFICMQSLNRENLSFVCVDPFMINRDYTVKLQENVLERLDVSGKDDVLILAVVTVSPDMTETTANLMGPLILNLKTNEGMQIILEDVDPELVRYNVWDGISAIEEEDARKNNYAG